MYHKSRIAMDEIVDWFTNDEIFFLIGAGFSASTTHNSVGTGKQLAVFLADTLDSQLKNFNINSIDRVLDDFMGGIKSKSDVINHMKQVIKKDGITLKEISDRFIVQKGEKSYICAVQDYFNSREGLILDTHKNLIPLIEKREGKISKPLIVSLNIDKLIERAYAEYFRGTKSLNTFIGGIKKSDYSRLQNCMLWKFHGCVSDFDSVVFDSFSYYKIRKSQEEAINELRQLFRDKHCIMLGISLQDDHIRDLIYSLYEGYNMPQAVIVSPPQYTNYDFINYMNEYMSLAHIDSEILDFLANLNSLV